MLNHMRSTLIRRALKTIDWHKYHTRLWTICCVNILIKTTPVWISNRTQSTYCDRAPRRQWTRIGKRIPTTHTHCHSTPHNTNWRWVTCCISSPRQRRQPRNIIRIVCSPTVLPPTGGTCGSTSTPVRLTLARSPLAKASLTRNAIIRSLRAPNKAAPHLLPTWCRLSTPPANICSRPFQTATNVSRTSFFIIIIIVNCDWFPMEIIQLLTVSVVAFFHRFQFWKKTHHCCFSSHSRSRVGQWWIQRLFRLVIHNKSIGTSHITTWSNCKNNCFYIINILWHILFFSSWNSNQCNDHYLNVLNVKLL